MQECWKCPIGYFFIKNLSASDLLKLIHTALHKLHDIGVRAISITGDGLGTNISTFKKLGAHPDSHNVNPVFLHPADSSLKVAVIQDACQMEKLVRACLSAYKTLLNEKGEKVS